MSESRQVFISYSHRDREWVRKFVNRLIEAGLRVWIDEKDIALGEPIIVRLEEALRSSDTLVFVLGPENIKSPNSYFELGAALGMGKRIIAVVSGNVPLEDLPAPIRSRRYLIMESPEETAREVAEALTAQI
ncbi:MAG: toll/interleukin-1 receptor domain-containing protein [Nitrososphaera sp.]|nr:toll/interleukin-1 receptor domain-containing protein [Nitrososphaera sp.]